MSKTLRAIPGVDKVLNALGPLDLPRAVVTDLVRRELSVLRKKGRVPQFEDVVAQMRIALTGLARARIQPVINGTGILIHTNLGRAPLGREAIDAMAAVAVNYNNLEFDLSDGQRGGRAAYLEYALAVLCGAEAATVVNNCAAALVLVLRHFIRRKPEVIISRGELVQIGGGFRIPEILQASGAHLREVGTTNKTSLADYEEAIGPETAMILRVHRSNFAMTGFVSSPGTTEIAAVAHKKRLPFVEDLGSGAVVDTRVFTGLEHEPTAAELLKRGADLVTFSGDKLLGGPQAGVIVGKARLISAIKREPFFRALRCDKLILSTLQAVVDAYLSGLHTRSIPALSMLGESIGSLRARAEGLVGSLHGAAVKAGVSSGKAQIGGGALPRSTIPSVTLDLVPTAMSLEALAARLRQGSPPVIGFLSAGAFKLDLRTVFPNQDEILSRVVRWALSLRSSGNPAAER